MLTMALAALMLAALAIAASAASRSRLTLYQLPTAGADPAGLAVGSDRAIWIAEQHAGAIGRLSRGHVHEYGVSGFPQSIAAGPDRALWFTEIVPEAIGRMTTSGRLTEFTLPDGIVPQSIAVGPDRALWFTAQVWSSGEPTGGAIGRITTHGAVRIVAQLGAIAPDAIALGSDRALWFTGGRIDRGAESPGAALIGRVDSHGGLQTFTVPGATLDPDLLAGPLIAGPGRALTFAIGALYGTISTRGAISAHNGRSGLDVTGLALGRHGALWATSYLQGVGPLARGALSAIRGAGDGDAILAARDGSYWFTDADDNAVGVAR